MWVKEKQMEISLEASKHLKECLKHFFLPFFLFRYRPDGKKKAYVRLARDYDALDVANKIGII
jgi:hypothetical protein